MSNRPALKLSGFVAALAVGVCGLFALMHAGVELGLVHLPVLPPVAVLYAVMAGAFAVVAYGALLQRPWSRKTASVVFAAAFVAVVWRLAIAASHGVSPVPFLLAAAAFAIVLMLLLPPRRLRRLGA